MAFWWLVVLWGGGNFHGSPPPSCWALSGAGQGSWQSGDRERGLRPPPPPRPVLEGNFCPPKAIGCGIVPEMHVYALIHVYTFTRIRVYVQPSIKCARGPHAVRIVPPGESVPVRSCGAPQVPPPPPHPPSHLCAFLTSTSTWLTDYIFVLEGLCSVNMLEYVALHACLRVAKARAAHGKAMEKKHDRGQIELHAIEAEGGSAERAEGPGMPSTLEAVASALIHGGCHLDPIFRVLALLGFLIVTIAWYSQI